MPPTVLAALVRLRQAERRYRLLLFSEVLAVLGLLPALATVPRLPGVRALALGVAFAYGLRRALALLRAHGAVRQLMLEEQFARFAHDPVQLRRCLQRTEHLWQHSLLLKAIHALLDHPPSLLLTPDERRRRIQRRFARAFRRFAPLDARIDAGLVLALTGALVTPWRLALDPSALLFQAGAVSFLLLLAAAPATLAYYGRLSDRLVALTDALAGWVVGDNLFASLHPRAPRGYAHTLLYRATPWFSAPPRAPRSPDAGSRLRRRRSA